MSPNSFRNAWHRTAACAAILGASALLQISPAQAGSVYTDDCIGGSGFGFSYDYHRAGGGLFGGSATGYGSASGSSYGQAGCVGTKRELTNPFVITIPQPHTEKEIAESAERIRLWQARCRPVVRQDQYGVRRYHYAAPGCEYGKYE